MHTQIPIPTKLVEVISNHIDFLPDFNSITETQKQSILKKLISLWYLIYHSQNTNYKIDNLKVWVNIHSKYLIPYNLKIGNTRLKYPHFIKILEDCKAIDVNTKFSKGAFSKSYRVTTSFLKDSFYTEMEIDFESIFKDTRDKDYWIDNLPKQKNLIEDAYNTKILLDEYLHWMQKNIGIELNPVFNKKKGTLKRRWLDPERIYKHFNLALRINFKNLFFSISNEGRFYNSISNLPNTAIPFLLMSNRKLKSIDIMNCQPLLLASILKNDEYQKDVELGIFYDNMGKELGKDRNVFKISSYKYLFFGNNQLKMGKTYSAMEKLYPGMMGLINSYKEENQMAIELQKLESEIFVNRIGGMNFSKLLRHDQVLVHEEYFEMLKSTVTNEFKRIGLKVSFNEK